MNYKKMKPEIKLKYIHNHISTVREYLEIAEKHLKWLSQDVKFIQTITEYEEPENDLLLKK